MHIREQPKMVDEGFMVEVKKLDKGIMVELKLIDSFHGWNILRAPPNEII